MNAQLNEIQHYRCLVLSDDGAPISSEDDARSLIEQALSERAEWVVVPVSRLDESFLVLRSGIAGSLLQKCVVYRRRIAFVGDVSQRIAESDSFRDFVIECNRGRDAWFVADRRALELRLADIDAREPQSR
jgi:hypothetical protein